MAKSSRLKFMTLAREYHEEAEKASKSNRKPLNP